MEEKKPVGRPRKFEPKNRGREKIDYTTKTFYFPLSLEYKAIWAEYCRICANLKGREFYSRMISFKKGIFLRRLIVKFVFDNTKDIVIRKYAEKTLELESLIQIMSA